MLNNFQLNTSLVYQSALLRQIPNANANANATVSVTVNATANASVFGSCRKKGTARTAGVYLYSTNMLAMFSKLFLPGQMQFLIYYLWYLPSLLVPAWGGRVEALGKRVRGMGQPNFLLRLNSAIWSAEAEAIAVAGDEAEAKQKLKLWLSSHFVCKYETFIKKIVIFLWTCVGEFQCVCVCRFVNLIFYMPVCMCVCVGSRTFCGWHKSNLVCKMFVRAPKRAQGRRVSNSFN